MTNSNRLRVFCLSLAGFGLAISVYLLFRHFALAGNTARIGIDVCSAIFGRGCDAALDSSFSMQLGIPLAGWGILYYAILITLLLLGGRLGESFQLKASLAAFSLSSLACLVSILLMLIMLTNTSIFCALCSITHLVNLVLVFSLKRLTGRSFRRLARDFMLDLKTLFSGKTEKELQSRLNEIGLLLIIFVAVAVYQWVRIEVLTNQRSALNAYDPLREIAVFKASIKQNMSIGDDDPILGPPDTPIRLVIFSDFQCPSCAEFSLGIHELSAQFEGKINIAFKHFPLGTTCNKFIERDIHPNACEAAFAAEAARQQGQFWAFHDALFAADLDDAQKKISMIAEEVGLNLKRFDMDRKSDLTEEKIRSDIKLGVELGIYNTPAIFLNGRQVFDLRPQVLELLIKYELQRLSSE